MRINIKKKKKRQREDNLYGGGQCKINGEPEGAVRCEERSVQYWCVLVAQSCEGPDSREGVKCCERSGERTLPAPFGLQ